MKTAGIYQITCTANGKIYIGSSVNIKSRISGHKSKLNKGCHDNKYLQNAWNKYGESSFIFEIINTIEEATIEIVRKVEQAILDSYSGDKWDLLFNMAISVDMTKLSEEACKARSKRVKAAWADPVYKEKMRKAMTRPDLVAKASETSKQRWATDEHRCKILAKTRKSGRGIRILKSGKYQAYINVKCKQLALGTFGNYEEALTARLEAEKLYWGETSDN